MALPLEADRLTQAEATDRAARVSGLHYGLDLDLEAGAKSYRGECTIRFDFSGGEGTFLDFTGSVIEQCTVNGIDREPVWHDNRVQLPPDWLAAGNEVRIRYVNNYDHAGEGFHQFFDPEDGSEYLYSQFEPFSAHRMFPCFDQPDLKATYDLTVTAPPSWRVLSAARVDGQQETADGRVRTTFETTRPFSTYLFSVVAGPYHSVFGVHRGIPLGVHCRATLVDHLDADELLALTARGMDFFSEFFGHPYPFAKYDQIFVPEFNWGGMENTANVTYTDRYLFRDPPTRTQRLGRAETYLHELAHMWFGDLVTMAWWNDVWLNESFASYMSFLALERVSEFTDCWQVFQADMKLWAMEADERPTTHHIADHISSTDETFLNFDGITYGKGAAALKQLVATVGEDGFRAGMQAYFARFAFGTATLADFLETMAAGSRGRLEDWSSAWLETASLDTLRAEWSAADGAITALWIRQEVPPAHPARRTHVVDVAVVGRAGGELGIDAYRVHVTGDPQPVAGAVGGSPPVLVFPNLGDHTYAKVVLDPVSLEFAVGHLDEIPDPLLRQQLWTSLWGMVRDRTWSSLEYLGLVERKLAAEHDLHIIKVVTGTAVAAIAAYVPEAVRIEAGRRLVAAGRRAFESAPVGDARVLWLRAMLQVAETTADLTWLAGVVDGELPVDGLAIDQEMRWALAVRWSAAGVAGAGERAQRELERDPSDRGRRRMLTAEVAAPEAGVKEGAWGRIHGDGYGSLELDRAAMAGFNWAGQAGLLEPYVVRFFDALPAVFETRTHEAATAYFGGLFPGYRVDAGTIDRARQVLSGLSGPPALERLLVEAIDDQARALACRVLAGS